MRRLWKIPACLLAVVVLGVAVLAVVTVRKSYPDASGTVQLEGIRGEVDVLRDDNGIPQIYADNNEDLFFAQGFVHAQDRFFEMDFRRHVTAGRLAELVGEGALETDKYIRTLGWRRVAEREVEELDSETRAFLEAYSAGVNAYVGERTAGDLSLEYSVLGLTGPSYQPEEWAPADSVAWIKAMAWDLRSNMNDEIGRVLSGEDLEPDEVEQLYPDFPYDIHDPIVPTGTVVDGAFDQSTSDADNAATATQELGLGRAAVESLEAAKNATDALPTLLGTGEGIGSNSWVVSGERTETGKPILANDPHLAPSMPGVWHQSGLHCRKISKSCDYDVAGFTFSGIPGIVVGHNDRVAWGVTTMYADVTDLYLERVTGNTVEYDGEQVPIETRTEKFRVAGSEDVEEITVRSTRHGPILSDLDEPLQDVGMQAKAENQTGGYEVSLRWTALRPQQTIKAVFSLGRTQNWQDFRKAAEEFTVPSQNLVYADVDGNIGYQSPGSIPIRKTGDGTRPVPGWDPDYDWDGTIPFDELPSVYNPDQGYIVTANQQVIGEQYPYVLGDGSATGYRSNRIKELLEDKPKLSVSDMTRIQMDSWSGNAANVVPELLEIDPGSSYYEAGRDTLDGWDFQQTSGSAAAAYFNTVWKHILRLTYHDDLPAGMHPDGGER